MTNDDYVLINPKLVESHGKKVWKNEQTDSYRAKYCMCFYCTSFGKCLIYEKAKQAVIEPFGLTFMVTRCINFKQAKKRQSTLKDMTKRESLPTIDIDIPMPPVKPTKGKRG